MRKIVPDLIVKGSLKEIVKNAKEYGIEVERAGSTYIFSVGIKSFTLREITKNNKGFPYTVIKQKVILNNGLNAYEIINKEKLREEFELLLIYK